jgi:hypothetical protein
MTEQQELEILRPYVTECGKLVNQNYELEKAYKATDDLLLSVLMGDVDPMQAMIDRMKIRDAYHEQS